MDHDPILLFILSIWIVPVTYLLTLKASMSEGQWLVLQVSKAITENVHDICSQEKHQTYCFK